MTLGTGIFSSTILIVLVFVVYQISIHKKWKLIGKLLAGLAGVCILIGLGTWFYIREIESQIQVAQLQPVTELYNVKLGMLEVDLTLAKGLPRSIDNSREPEKWTYSDSQVGMRTNSDGVLAVSYACNDKPIGQGALSNLSVGDFSIYSWTSEEDIINKFGSPSRESINEDGTLKLISYASLNVAFELERREIVRVCITSGLRGLGYLTEYGEIAE